MSCIDEPYLGNIRARSEVEAKTDGTHNSTTTDHQANYLPLTMSYASIPNAKTMALHPRVLQIVTVSTALPKMASDMNTSTMVSRLPTEVTMGPHTPMRT